LGGVTDTVCTDWEDSAREAGSRVFERGEDSVGNLKRAGERDLGGFGSMGIGGASWFISKNIAEWREKKVRGGQSQKAQTPSSNHSNPSLRTLS